MMIKPSDILNANILVVDDKPANISLLEELLSDVGYTRITSTTQPQKVSALHLANSYDLILLDLQMPGMDGFEVMERLKTHIAEPYLPVIVLTAEPRHKLLALQAGAVDFISKPFDLLEVRTRIHNMLEVRLLYRKLAQHNQVLEQTVRERTAALKASEARFRSLTELASDWYWEQNATGDFTEVSGPVLEVLGLSITSFLGRHVQGQITGWNETERERLRAKIAAREPFIDFPFTRADTDGSTQHFRVSGEPIFDQSARFTGFRGIGIEVAGKQ